MIVNSSSTSRMLSRSLCRTTVDCPRAVIRFLRSPRAIYLQQFPRCGNMLSGVQLERSTSRDGRYRIYREVRRKVGSGLGCSDVEAESDRTTCRCNGEARIYGESSSASPLSELLFQTVGSPSKALLFSYGQSQELACPPN